MNAFETLIAMLLRRQGYWTALNVKVKLTAEEKRKIGRHSAPRWDIDVVAYKGATNEVLAVECKSYLDSTGVKFRNGEFDPPRLYKLFAEKPLRDIVLARLREELVHDRLCPPAIKVTLCLAAGKIATQSDADAVQAHFDRQGWRLFTPEWVVDHLGKTAEAAYEDDLALMVAKLLKRARRA